MKYFPIKRIYIPFLISFFLLSSSCRVLWREMKLDPEGKRFLSEVRYVITKEEKKIFIELPVEDREQFIDEFWKKRDPDPDTEVNEFKEQYYERISEANKLFRGGKPGWLQDRGRIYILLGPPHERNPFPLGSRSIPYPHEIWYYGMFPVTFVDYSRNGNYVLTTPNVYQIHELNISQAKGHKTFKKEKSLFDYDWYIKKIKEEENKVDVSVIIEVPYENLWFTAKDDKMETTLQLCVEVRGDSGQKIRKFENDYLISTTDRELETNRGEKYVIEIPLVLTKGIYIIHSELINTTGEEKLTKELKFHL